MQRSDGFCNLQPILEELRLVLEFHLVVENVLKRDLIESRVFVNEDLSLIRDFSSLGLDLCLLLKLVLHLFDSVETDSNFHVKTCFTY